MRPSVNTYFVFDIDTTIANNDDRAKLLHPNCVVCGVPMTSSDGSAHQNTWFCSMCGGTDSKIQQAGWDAFMDEDAMLGDRPIPAAQEFMKRLRHYGANIHFITGRSERARTVTETWLSTHYQWDPNREFLLMRGKEHAGKPASVYKDSAINDLKTRLQDPGGLYFFFEDDAYVFSMYAQHGIVLKCPEAFAYFNPPGLPRSLEKAWNR